MSKLVPFLKDSASKNVLPFHNVQALKYEVMRERERERERDLYCMYDYHECLTLKWQLIIFSSLSLSPGQY